MEMTDLTSKLPSTPSKYMGLGAAIAAELMIGFLFSIGVMLAVGVVDSLNYCVSVLASSSSELDYQ